MMLGHCAGLRNSQQLATMCWAHAYVREDHVLDEELPLWVPIPALAEIQAGMQRQAVADVTDGACRPQAHHAHRYRSQSTDNRNWELLCPTTCPSCASARAGPGAGHGIGHYRRQWLPFSKIPYGTLLCVATNRCTAKSNCQAWPTTSTVSEWTSIYASACALSTSCEGGSDRLHTAASCAALTNKWPSSKAPAMLETGPVSMTIDGTINLMTVALHLPWFMGQK